MSGRTTAPARGSRVPVFLLSLLVCLVLWSISTEWLAWKLAYQPQLGLPLWTVGDWRIYPPYAFILWWMAYGNYAPRLFDVGGLVGAGGGLAAAAVALLGGWLADRPGKAATFGSARWAKGWDVFRAGLLRRHGVVLGRLGLVPLRFDSPGHVLCVAPTRSGKGVGVVVPTLLTWSHSAVVHDIKGENWELTAGWRAGIGRVIRFDPTDPRCDAFNPLMEVRPGPHEVRDAQNIADLLVDPQGSLQKFDHWERTSHTLLVGAILHVLYAEPDKTLTGVAAFLSNPEHSIDWALKAMLTTRHKDGQPHPVVAQAARELMNKSVNERSGVVSTALSFLALYRDPIIAEATRRSDWRIADLVSPAAPATLYLVVPPSDISRTRPLIRLILNQIGRRLTEERPDRRTGRRLLMLLDEFPTLGRLDFFETSLAYQAGYGITCLLVAQSLNQLERAYGPNHSILENCHVRIFFATNDERTARRVSDALGVATEQRALTNYGGRWGGQISVSQQETPRPLMTPGEVMQMPDRQELILVGGRPPIRARKVRYFRSLRLAARVLRAPLAAAAAARPEREAPWTSVIEAPPERPAELPEEAGGEARSTVQGETAAPEGGEEADFLDDPTDRPPLDPLEALLRRHGRWRDDDPDREPDE